MILQKKCIQKCLKQFKPSNIPSKIPEELADEDNDPVRPRPTGHRPSFSPPLVSSVCFIFITVSTHCSFIATCFNRRK